MQTTKSLRAHTGRSCIAIVFITVSLLVYSANAFAVATPTLPWDISLPQSDYLLRRLGHTFEVLRNTAKDDPELHAILENVRLRAPRKSIYDESPNAWAMPGFDAKYVLIESRFVSQIAALAAAGGYLVWSDIYGKNANARQLICGQLAQIDLAAKQSNTKPRFEVGAEKFPEYSNPAVRRGLLKTSGLVMDQTMVWFLLHEIGHHALQHLPKVNLSNQQSRLDEQAADQWASQAMRRLGFSLFFVERYLEGRDVIDKCLAELGYIFDESDSTHPSWATRATKMRAQFDTGAVDGGYPRTIYVPAEPSDLFLVIDAPGKDAETYVTQNYLTSRAASEWQDNEITVYINSPSGDRIEFLIQDASRVVLWVTQLQYPANSSQSSSWLRIPAIQLDPNFMDWTQPIPGMYVSDLRRLDKNALLINNLRQTGATETQITKVIQAKDEFHEIESPLVVKYMKGQVQFNELNALIEPAITRLNNKLEAILGKDVVARYRQIEANDPLMAWAPGQKADFYKKLEEKFLDDNFRE